VEYVFSLPEVRQPAILAISAFDGIHRRHQRMLAQAIMTAERLGITPVALLPWPSASDVSGGMLTTLGERIALIEQFAPASRPVVLAAQSTQEWTPASLAERITAGWEVRGLIVDAASDERLSGIQLADEARRSGVSVTVLATEDGEAPPGTQIRAALTAGRVAEATQYMGQEYTLSGEVVGGDRRGRLLGFPTANLRVDTGKVIPGNGIYAVRVRLPGDAGVIRPAVASIGVRPTFGDGNARLVEVHLLDLNMDLYGVRIETSFVEWLRLEERFDSVEALIQQMAMDVAQARERLARDDTPLTASHGSARQIHQGDAHP
jgi:riboflavin kinase / FMN adenylyltransferase